MQGSAPLSTPLLHHCWALHVAVGSYASLLGLTRHCWVLHIILGPYAALPNPLSLLGMVSVFQENRVRIHVKFMFAWKTVRLFPVQTKRKHNKIIPSVFAQK